MYNKTKKSLNEKLHKLFAFETYPLNTRVYSVKDLLAGFA